MTLFGPLMKSAVLLSALLGFALINTAFLGVYLFSGSSVGGLSAGPAYPISGTTTMTMTASSTATELSTASSQNASAPTATQGPVSNATSGSDQFAAATSAPNPRAASVLQSTVRFFEAHSPVLAPASWFFVGGMWIWRGRMKSRWTDLGFDSDVFGLFVRMKGAKTRIRLLDALSVPKDRLQLAQELGLDWKAVDRHIEILDKYGFVHETVAYGKVRMYGLTSTGKLLLQLLDELNRQVPDEPSMGFLPTAMSPLPRVIDECPQILSSGLLAKTHADLT
jgi:hypothetical protein